MDGYGHVMDTPRIRLALLRDDLETVERLVFDPPSKRGWYRGCIALASITTRLDALGALADRNRLEAETTSLLRPNTYLEPFALRALGVVREDESLIERAAARFDAMGLDWHAARTRALLR